MAGPGTYAENIVWPSTNGIDLVSESGAAVTIIDGATISRVIEITTGIDSTTRIDGFTIQNGWADFGAGILCRYSSSPVITNNIITHNTAIYPGAGGIGCSYSSSPYILGNTISHNAADSGGGGGILCTYDANAMIVNNTITNNTCNLGGGGILIFENCAPTLSGNTITGNVADGGGGGLCFQTTRSIVTRNIVSFNISHSGGGVFCSQGDSSVIRGNTITYNIADTMGAGIHCKTYATPHIDSCTITDNNGDGIYCYMSANPLICFNDINDNSGYGINNAYSGVLINAENNWWGDSTGPYHSTNPGGLGDSVSDYVDFTPWLYWPGVKENPDSKPVNKREIICASILTGPLHLPLGKSCKVVDITGRVVMPDKMRPGVYFIEIEGKIAQKVIKIR
jgi:parallel beta-helix repeat protein